MLRRQSRFRRWQGSAFSVPSRRRRTMPRTLRTELALDAVGEGDEMRRVFGVNHDLYQAGAVAQVNENEFAEIALPVYPAVERDFLL